MVNDQSKESSKICLHFYESQALIILISHYWGNSFVKLHLYLYLPVHEWIAKHQEEKHS
jgi:hypothetical protein